MTISNWGGFIVCVAMPCAFIAGYVLFITAYSLRQLARWISRRQKRMTIKFERSHRNV